MVARTDQTTDPVLLQSLLQARRGTAFFARKLNELTDAELDGGTRCCPAGPAGTSWHTWATTPAPSPG
jgi:hypothetical protein